MFPSHEVFPSTISCLGNLFPSHDVSQSRSFPVFPSHDIGGAIGGSIAGPVGYAFGSGDIGMDILTGGEAN